jgi:hypothetical protein
MVWIWTAVRSLAGWSSEGLRAADLVIFTAVVWLLARGTQPQSLSRAASVWIATALYLLYFSATEWSHCQPDGWELLPTLGALYLRQRQAAALMAVETSNRALALRALAEGALWGAALIVKPFPVISALPCLLLAWLQALGTLRKLGAVRRFAWDAGGIVAGGLLVVAGTAAVLYLTGDWSEFVACTFSGWNNDYASLGSGWLHRTNMGFVERHWPWGLLHGAAIPVAAVLIVRSLSGRTAPVDDAAGLQRLALLAAFYLSWFFQANYLQLQFEYHTTPALLLAWALVPGSVARLRRRTACGGVLAAAVLLLAVCYHPLLAGFRLAYWADCWTSQDSDRLKDGLAINATVGHTSWVDLGRLVRFLRLRGVRDREVTCWHWSATPLYSELRLQPSNRFLYPGTRMRDFFRSHKQTIMDETLNSPQRYVVFDLLEMGYTPDQIRLELDFPPKMFEPLQPRGLFRAGRYIVIAVSQPPCPTAGSK